MNAHILKSLPIFRPSNLGVLELHFGLGLTNHRLKRLELVPFREIDVGQASEPFW